MVKNKRFESYILAGMFLWFFLLGIGAEELFEGKELPWGASITITVVAFIAAKIWTR